MDRVLHVLTGPTAVGKTELALAWAERAGAEIVSCDSVLFYRGMDIGAAKPAPAERARVPHHLIDILDVTERMDVAEFVDRALAACGGIASRGRRVLVTGGSGFYLKAFFAPVADAVDVPAGVRAEVASLLAAGGPAALLAELKLRNPAGLGGLDVRNPRRVARALERCRASGRTLAELAASFAAQRPPFADWAVRLVRLDRPREALNARIDARVRAMLERGLVDEVRGLLAAGLPRDSAAGRAIGYRETIACLDGRLAERDLGAEIARDTRALVKKQLTWFRTQLPPHEAISAETATPETLFEEKS